MAGTRLATRGIVLVASRCFGCGCVRVSPGHTPKNYTSNFCERAFARTNRDWIDEQALQYGAVLLCGFDNTLAAEVERDVQALEPQLSAKYVIGAKWHAICFFGGQRPVSFSHCTTLGNFFFAGTLPTPLFCTLQAHMSVGGATASMECCDVGASVVGSGVDDNVGTVVSGTIVGVCVGATVVGMAVGDDVVGAVVVGLGVGAIVGTVCWIQFQLWHPFQVTRTCKWSMAHVCTLYPSEESLT